MQRSTRGDVVDGELALVAEHAVSDSAALLKCTCDEVETGLELVEFARQVGEIGRTGRAVVELAGIGLGVGDQLATDFTGKSGRTTRIW